MDDFNGEVSCTEVLGIEPGEQALTHGFSARCSGACWRGERESQSVFPPTVGVSNVTPPVGVAV